MMNSRFGMVMSCIPFLSSKLVVVSQLHILRVWIGVPLNPPPYHQLRSSQNVYLQIPLKVPKFLFYRQYSARPRPSGAMREQLKT